MTSSFNKASINLLRGGMAVYPGPMFLNVRNIYTVGGKKSFAIYAI